MFHQHTWFEEGTSEGSRRCCRMCGKIEVAIDPRSPTSHPNLSVEEAESLQARAGYNKHLHDAVRHRTAWAVVGIFIVAVGAYQLGTQGGLSVGLLPLLLIALCATAYHSGKVTRLRRSQPSPSPDSQVDTKHAVESVEIARLISDLDESDDQVYGRAISALVGLGEPAIPPLLRTLGNKREAWLRRKNAALALGRMTCSFDHGILIAALHDADRNVQQGAAWAVGNLRLREAVSPLSALLRDVRCSWYTKAVAVEALGNIGTREARAALSWLSSRIEELHEMLRRGERAPELETLLDYLGRRHLAFGGDLEDVNLNDLRPVVESALHQFQDGIQEALRRINQ